MKPKTVMLGLAAGAAAVLVLLQAVPYGRNHTNPPVTGEPAWNAPRIEALARSACFDCHSNESRWPWYASIAPVSWRIQNHVDEGRGKLNFSAFDRPQEEATEAADVVRSGEMPPSDYLLMHPEARLSPADRQALADGFVATFGAGEGGERGEGRTGGRDDDDSGDERS
jgi:Haem-binding domain